jgi:thiol:disulfide interchange protein DsbD
MPKSRIGLIILAVLAAGIVTVDGQMKLNMGKLAQPSASPQNPVTIHVAETGSSVDSILEVDIALAMPPSVHIYAADTLFFQIVETQTQGLGASTVNLPQPYDHVNFDGSRVKVFKDSQKIRITIPIIDTAWLLEGYVQYQACDSNKCFLPAKKHFQLAAGGRTGVMADTIAATGTSTDDHAAWRTALAAFNIAGKSGGYQSSGDFIAFLDNPESAGEASSFLARGVILVVILTLLGGIALNVTPCVLPMIPITLAVIGAGSVAGSKRRGFIIGGIYGLGMALSYGLLGVVVGLSGTQFGAINASPAFNLFIAAVFVVLSLAMFDLLHIDFTRWRGGVRTDTKRRGTVIWVFLMGALAALLAGACVAPVVISVILYASTLYANGQPAGLLLPFVLGIGMALPWPFAGAGITFLPKPGAWMNRVKNVFGILILLMAVYYGYTAISLLKSDNATQLQQNHHTASNLTWYTSLDQALNLAAVEKKPVFIDFWATWCKNCTVMDATTMRHPAVAQRLERFVLVRFQAENPDDPAIRAVLRQFGIIGLPGYVVLRPN